MKKKTTLLLIFAICFVQLISVFTVNAEGASPVKIKYGESAEVELKLAESFEDSIIPDAWAGALVELNSDDELELITLNGTFADIYGITTEMIDADPTIQQGAKYYVFSFENNSDGSVWFCFQPDERADENDANHLYSSGTFDEGIIMVDSNGTAEQLIASDSASVNSRYGFVVPADASGYLFVPVSIITGLGSWDTPKFEGDPDIDGIGFHIANNDSTYVEFIIGDMFVCGDLPEYVKPTSTPEPTATPTEEPTQSPTETPSQDPTQEPTKAPTKAPDSSSSASSSTSDTVPDNSSNSSNLGLIIAIICIAVIIISVIVFIVIKKKKA